MQISGVTPRSRSPEERSDEGGGDEGPPALNRGVTRRWTTTSSRVGRHPKYIISDHGTQFRDDYRQWCATRGIKPRFGAIGRYGSIAVAERFILSLKNELTRRLLVPLGLARMRSELASFFNWYNVERPHEFLNGATPVEILIARRPANKRPRLEPRSRYPANARCAAPNVKAGDAGCVLKLVVSGPQHSPVVRLKKAA